MARANHKLPFDLAWNILEASSFASTERTEGGAEIAKLAHVRAVWPSENSWESRGASGGVISPAQRSRAMPITVQPFCLALWNKCIYFCFSVGLIKNGANPIFVEIPWLFENSKSPIFGAATYSNNIEMGDFSSELFSNREINIGIGK